MNTLIDKLPNPISVLTDPISLIVYVLFGGLMLIEAIFPARELPKIKHWKLKGTIFLIAYALLSTYIPIFWDDFFAQYQLIDLSSLYLPFQIGIGVLLFEFIQYGWHRLMHKSDFFFRVSHQIHHSAERLDVPSAFMFSINDIAGLSLVGSLCFALLIGLTPQAISIIVIMLTFFGIFQHANIKTPQWIGYIIQRPESHTLHHAKGIHHYNYTDLPIIDILFGTFKNPKNFEYETGYYLGASDRLLEMILFKDVTTPKDNSGA